MDQHSKNQAITALLIEAGKKFEGRRWTEELASMQAALKEYYNEKLIVSQFKPTKNERIIPKNQGQQTEIEFF